MRKASYWLASPKARLCMCAMSARSAFTPAPGVRRPRNHGASIRKLSQKLTFTYCQPKADTRSDQNDLSAPNRAASGCLPKSLRQRSLQLLVQSITPVRSNAAEKAQGDCRTTQQQLPSLIWYESWLAPSVRKSQVEAQFTDLATADFPQAPDARMATSCFRSLPGIPRRHSANNAFARFDHKLASNTRTIRPPANIDCQ
jgi:hypothetical protein